MKYLNDELKILKFELFQCKDIVTGKVLPKEANKVKELKTRIVALQNILNKVH